MYMYTHFQFVSSTERRSDSVVGDNGLPPCPVYQQYPAVLNLQIQSTVLINFPSTCKQCELHRPLDSNPPMNSNQKQLPRTGKPAKHFRKILHLCAGIRGRLLLQEKH